MKPVLLGLDASSTAIGWCLIRSGGEIASGALRPKDEIWSRVLELRYWLRHMIVLHGVTHIGVEQPLRTDIYRDASDDDDEYVGSGQGGGYRTKVMKPMASYDSFRALYAVAGEIQTTCLDLNVECTEINQTSWRAKMLGTARAPKGTPSDKRTAWFKKKAREVCDTMGLPAHTHDEAEAILIAVFHLAKVDPTFVLDRNSLFWQGAR